MITYEFVESECTNGTPNAMALIVDAKAQMLLTMPYHLFNAQSPRRLLSPFAVQIFVRTAFMLEVRISSMKIVSPSHLHAASSPQPSFHYQKDEMQNHGPNQSRQNTQCSPRLASSMVPCIVSSRKLYRYSCALVTSLSEFS